MFQIFYILKLGGKKTMFPEMCFKGLCTSLRIVSTSVHFFSITRWARSFGIFNFSLHHVGCQYQKKKKLNKKNPSTYYHSHIKIMPPITNIRRYILIILICYAQGLHMATLRTTLYSDFDSLVFIS